MANRSIAMVLHKEWLEGQYLGVEPQRRLWVLANMFHLKDKVLLCFEWPRKSHVENYVWFLDKRKISSEERYKDGIPLSVALCDKLRVMLANGFKRRPELPKLSDGSQPSY